MKKLLNTLYITKEDVYLSKESENIVIQKEGQVLGRFPFHIIENIVCFNYAGASPSLMKYCMENNILISFHTPNGKYCGRVIGKTNGNVLLRKEQYRMSDSEELSVEFVRNIIYAKAYNSRKLLQRLVRDHSSTVDVLRVNNSIDKIKIYMEEIKNAKSKDSIRGLEGSIAREYFSSFDEMILNQREDFYFFQRSKRPPTDNVNALLSYLYSLLTNEMISALEGVGIDSYVGFFHVDRPGRASMALDMMEELRAYMCDRAALTLINNKIINKNDFETKENDAVLLNSKGRDKIFEYWRNRKNETIIHPYLEENIKIGLLMHVQAMLLNRYIRGDLEAYPPFLIKG